MYCSVILMSSIHFKSYFRSKDWYNTKLVRIKCRKMCSHATCEMNAINPEKLHMAWRINIQFENSHLTRSWMATSTDYIYRRETWPWDIAVLVPTTHCQMRTCLSTCWCSNISRFTLYNSLSKSPLSSVKLTAHSNKALLVLKLGTFANLCSVYLTKRNILLTLFLAYKTAKQE